MPARQYGVETGNAFIGNSPSLEAQSMEQVDPELMDEQTQKKLDAFRNLQKRASKLRSEWSGEMSESVVRRNLRNVDVDILAKRAQGELKKDEIVIPIRVIDDNIKKEQPQYVMYITKNRVPAIFKSRVPTDLPVPQIEEYFRELFKYPGWEVDFIQLTDSSELHGRGYLEVKADDTKSGFFSNNYVPYENLMYSKDVYKLQKSTIILHKQCVSLQELRDLPEVNQEELSKIVNLRSADNTTSKTIAEAVMEDSFIEFFKVYYRDSTGVVNVCWMDVDRGSDFLREPQPLYLGVDQEIKTMSISVDPATGMPTMTPQSTWEPIYEKLYPFYVLPYGINETAKIIEIKGRAFMDEHLQTAVISMISNIVNAWHRASRITASPRNTVSGKAAMQTNVSISPGYQWSEPVDFFHMPYPDSSGLAIVQSLLIRNKSESGQVDFAVTEKRSSRTTAKEVDAAQEQASTLSSSQVIVLSIFFREILSRNWSIVKSKAKQGFIKDIILKTPELLDLPYNILPAGDVEVIDRAEQKQNMAVAYPLVANTPAGLPMLKDILYTLFPAKADKYVEALDSGFSEAQFAGVIKALGGILEEIVKNHPEVIPPGQGPQIQQILAMANQAMQAGEKTQPSQPTQPGGQSPQPKQITNGQSNTRPSNPGVSSAQGPSPIPSPAMANPS